jgi:hypothetical protein
VSRSRSRGASRATPDPKWCVSCGRTIEWRKKWERDWPHVKYCSDACRRAGVNDVDRRLEVAILDLLNNRAHGATICPSEAAKAVSGSDDESAWRDLMEPARRAARRLVIDGQIDVTQAGHVVDASTASGPIRLRRRTIPDN